MHAMKNITKIQYLFRMKKLSREVDQNELENSELFRGYMRQHGKVKNVPDGSKRKKDRRIKYKELKSTIENQILN